MAKLNSKSFLVNKLFKTRNKTETLQTKSATSYKVPYNNFKSYIQTIGKPVWTKREYEKFSEEGYIRNVIANRCISLK